MSTIPKGNPSEVFTIKSAADVPAATNSKHFKGFVFVGNSNLELSTTKGTFG